MATDRTLNKISEIERFRFDDVLPTDINFLLKNYDDLSDKGFKLVCRWMKGGYATGLQQIKFLELEGSKYPVGNLAPSAQNWLLENPKYIPDFLGDLLKSEKIARGMWQQLASLFSKGKLEKEIKKFAKREDAPIAFVSAINGEPVSTRASRRSEREEEPKRTRRTSRATSGDEKPRRPRTSAPEEKGVVAEAPFALIVYSTPGEARKAAKFLKDDGDLNSSQQRLCRKIVEAAHTSDVAELIASYKKRHHIIEANVTVKKSPHRSERLSSGRVQKIVGDIAGPSEEDLERSNDRKTRRSGLSEVMAGAFGKKAAAKNEKSSDDTSSSGDTHHRHHKVRKLSGSLSSKARSAIRTVRRPE